MKNAKIFCLLAAVFLLAACSTTNGRYTAISTKPVSLWDLSRRNQVVASKVGTVEGRHIALIVPLGSAPNVGDAVADILEEYNGDYIANAEIVHRSMQVMFWYHYSGWEITGDIMKIVR